MRPSAICIVWQQKETAVKHHLAGKTSFKSVMFGVVGGKRGGGDGGRRWGSVLLAG